MPNFPYKVSVLVPIYNVERFLTDTLESIVQQTIDLSEIEVLLLDDGSPDNSIHICEQYAQKYPCFKILRKENEGLSKTRNFGIAHAQGKYLFYLDGDDTITPETLENVTSLFDRHYDEIDLVTYPIIPLVDGKPGTMHFRYLTLNNTGIYDLTLPENAYITQTNINICVKNRPGENVLFDTTPNFRHEDQKYCTQVLQRKMKIGYCQEAAYLYVHHAESIVRTYFFAYYIYETTMDFWEKLFGEYPDAVPPYIQGLYLNDLNWKMMSDILFPYHYTGEKYETALQRIWSLLRRVDDSVILLHPTIDPFHKYYFIQQKGDGEISALKGPADLALIKDHALIYTTKRIEIVITKFKVKNGVIKMIGFVKSPLFRFIDPPKLFLLFYGVRSGKMEIPLSDSSWNYYKAKTSTNSFFTFILDLPTQDITSFKFRVNILGQNYATYFYFMPDVPFNLSVGRDMLFVDGMQYRVIDNTIYIDPENHREKKKNRKTVDSYYLGRDKNVALMRRLARAPISHKRIWLYYDCAGVKKDNGYYQFIHDFYQDDGVVRYYVVNDTIDRSDLFDRKQRRHLVRFGSFWHKMLFFHAEKIITAFIEKVNYIPFLNDVIPHYADLMQYDLIYLQHGILHAHTPWKYSLDRLNLDKEVISSNYEKENLIHNYQFTPEYLIPSGMPRYDHIDTDKPAQKRILFAPSWRKYLIASTADGKWVATRDKFSSSDFFRQTQAFLNSPKLADALEKYDYHLDFKLHPIFDCYYDLYEISSDRVHLVREQSISEFEYALFMTDFSSFLFDFVYLCRPLIYFVPDCEQFSSGMNDYRELDIPFERGFGPYAQTASEAVEQVLHLLRNSCRPQAPYMDRIRSFFIDHGKHHMDMLYQALIES